jgi:hypothetical protein
MPDQLTQARRSCRRAVEGLRLKAQLASVMLLSSPSMAEQ